jgi:hypothetical protein
MKESYLVGKLDDTSVLLFAIDSVPWYPFYAFKTVLLHFLH